MQNRFNIPLSIILTAGCMLAAVKSNNVKPNIPADPTPGEPLAVTMGQRTPVRIRVARNQATLIRQIGRASCRERV